MELLPSSPETLCTYCLCSFLLSSHPQHSSKALGTNSLFWCHLHVLLPPYARFCLLKSMASSDSVIHELDPLSRS